MIKSPEDRSKAVAKLIKAAGGKLVSYYVTFGEYDFLLVPLPRGFDGLRFA